MISEMFSNVSVFRKFLSRYYCPLSHSRKNDEYAVDEYVMLLCNVWMQNVERPDI